MKKIIFDRPTKYSLITVTLYIIFAIYALYTYDECGWMGCFGAWLLALASFPISILYAFPLSKDFLGLSMPEFIILSLIQYFYIGYLIGRLVDKIKKLRQTSRNTE